MSLMVVTERWPSSFATIESSKPLRSKSVA